jgi:multicomponent K+:H+ antiporter subunit D
MFLLVALAVTGMPPLSGFVGKFLILQASVASPRMPWVIGVVLLTSLLTIVAMARSGTRLFFKIDANAAAAAAPLQLADLAAPVALLVAGAAMVIYAGPLHDFSEAAAEQLVVPSAYLDAVLQGARETGLP